MDVGINQGNEDTAQVILIHGCLALKLTIIVFSMKDQVLGVSPQNCQVRLDFLL